jgi:hypothetical protein
VARPCGVDRHLKEGVCPTSRRTAVTLTTPLRGWRSAEPEYATPLWLRHEVEITSRFAVVLGRRSGYPPQTRRAPQTSPSSCLQMKRFPRDATHPRYERARISREHLLQHFWVGSGARL